MNSPFLVVEDVHKSYGRHEALRGLSFEVRAGELFGLLGPNGAGKTTLLSIVACLAEASRGSIRLGHKVLNRRDLEARRAIGIGTQELSVYADLTARENLGFFGRLYGLRGKELAERIEEVLEMAGLRERADQRVGTFSGGMKRRLNLGVAVIHRPQLLLLDEPTTGVDPQSRNHIFERVRELNAAGMTIVYTSHYMEEVQALCPRIGIIDNGRLIACDTITGLLRQIQGTIEIRVAAQAARVRERASRLPDVHVKEQPNSAITVATHNVSATLIELIELLRELNVALVELKIQEPTLENVFLFLTQATLRD